MQNTLDKADIKPRILIVDDEKANLKILAELLSEQADVSLAKSGQQAIEKAVQLLPDLILLDIIMPEMDGFETIQRLRQVDSLEAVPVIFITGLDTADNERYGLDLGAQDYIRKPFNPAVVKSRIATHLKVIKQNKELRSLSRKLREADEAKSRFLANMSHEIRTPLTAIIGYAELLQKGELTNVTPEQAVDIIFRSGEHLLHLINDILDISKIEANKLQVEHVPVSLPSLIEEVCSLVKSKIEEKNLTFEKQIDFPIPGTIVSDPTRIKQILLNLLNNAVKFTEQGVIRLEISVEGEFLGFQVIDSGIGIEQSQQANIFSAFEQADVSVTRKFGGTGLGLNISKSLASRLGGGIALHSEPGKGSRFSLKILANVADDSQSIESMSDYQQHLSQQRNAELSVDRLVGKVMLVDDQAELRQLISMMLGGLGLDVVEAENGRQLLEKASSETFDLILCDIHMPVMGGEEAVASLKKQGILTPVIALTANAMKHEIDHYIEKGFSEHLSKPIQRSDFIAKLSRFLQHNETPSTETPVSGQQAHSLVINSEHRLHYLDEMESAFFDADWATLKTNIAKLMTTTEANRRDEVRTHCRDIEDSLGQVDNDMSARNTIAERMLALRELLEE